MISTVISIRLLFVTSIHTEIEAQTLSKSSSVLFFPLRQREICVKPSTEKKAYRCVPKPVDCGTGLLFVALVPAMSLPTRLGIVKVQEASFSIAASGMHSIKA